MKTYVIHDWAGNHLFKDKEFNTAIDGFDFLLTKFDNDDDLQEHYVVPKQN